MKVQGAMVWVQLGGHHHSCGYTIHLCTPGTEPGGHAVDWGRQTADSELCPVLGGDLFGEASALCRTATYLNFSNQSLVSRQCLST